MRVASDIFRNARVRHHKDRLWTACSQNPHVLRHLLRTGGAVDPDDIDIVRLKRDQRRGDLRAKQECPHRLNGHRNNDGKPGAGLFEVFENPAEGSL